jgi:hypothetical protein
MITIRTIRTEENKLMSVFVKDESFFILFSRFLIGCGLEWGYNEDREGTTNIMESYRNDFYDIDLFFGIDIVFVSIRTFNKQSSDGVKKWISNNTVWQNQKLKI